MISHLSGAHHDGSDLYVSNSSPEFEEVIQVRLRVAKPNLPNAVSIRAVYDGEPRIDAATISHETDTDIWWVAELTARNFAQNYRWLLTGGTFEFAWLNAEGLSTRDVSDAADFLLIAHPPAPTWMSKSVAYQIFPDRFSRSAYEHTPPDYFVKREWDQLPEGKSRNTGREWFGGDIWGIADRLDYLQNLGIDLVYLTPFFPGHSTHRYDAQTFDEVDPLLGGNEALIHLVESAHARGMKVVGDITLNHCGRYHEWFTTAQAGDLATRDFFTFDDRMEHGYECWFNVPSLPKFNFHSELLRERLITGENSVIRKWLSAPFNLDGWRVDVANMAGRQGEVDLTHEIARLTRQVVMECGSDKILIAEHFHDAGQDLVGDGWQGGMNYTSTQNPIWSWLLDADFAQSRNAETERVKTISTLEAIATINDFSARMPWRSRLASWSLMGSHDTARIRTVVGSDPKQIAAAGFLFGLPGTPMIFMGDEFAAQGKWGEDSRTPMPWDQIETLNLDVQSAYKFLIELRRNSEALCEGGFRWVAASEDGVAFLRESKDEQLLFVITRTSGRIELPNWLGFSNRWTSIFGHYETDENVAQSKEAGTGIWRAN
jgi:alpha-glucosidase